MFTEVQQFCFSSVRPFKLSCFIKCKKTTTWYRCYIYYTCPLNMETHLSSTNSQHHVRMTIIPSFKNKNRATRCTAVSSKSNFLREPINPEPDVSDRYSPISEITVIQISPVRLDCSFNQVVINYLECTLYIAAAKQYWSSRRSGM